MGICCIVFLMVLEGKPNSSSKISIHDRKKEIKKKNKTMVDHREKPKRSANGVGTMKSRIKEMGPICKSRKKHEKDSPTDKQEDDEEGFFWLFNNQVNQQESLWLSSESLSPLYKDGDFMFTSPLDYLIDERLISFLSSYRGISFFDRKEKEDESWLLEPLESTVGSSCEISSCLDSSSTALSKCIHSSSLFWDLDRTNMWVSLINLDGEDCKWISNVELDSENIESNFPSPTYKNKRSFDAHSFDVDVDVDVSSSMRSFHDELSSELLSGSLDLDDMDFDEPLMWPFDEKYESSYISDSFCQSLRRDLGSSTSLLKKEGRKVHSKFIRFKHGSRRIVIASRNTKLNRSSRNSMKIMLSGSKLGKKHKLGKGNLIISAKRLQEMSMVNIDELDWWPYGSSSSSTTTKSQSHSDSSLMDFESSDLCVSLINLNGEDSQWISGIETDWEEGLKSNFPSPSYKNRKNQVFWSSENGHSFQDELSQLDFDEPLFWPFAKDQTWSMDWDDFCMSPRRSIFGNSTSIRVRIHDQRSGFKRSLVPVSGLSASKINNGFKHGCGKKGNGRKAKAMKSIFGRSGARKLSRNIGEKMEVIMENDIEGVVQVEKTLGLQEFDGHEGLDMEFHTESFSILEE